MRGFSTSPDGQVDLATLADFQVQATITPAVAVWLHLSDKSGNTSVQFAMSVQQALGMSQFLAKAAATAAKSTVKKSSQ